MAKAEILGSDLRLSDYDLNGRLKDEHDHSLFRKVHFHYYGSKIERFKSGEAFAMLFIRSASAHTVPHVVLRETGIKALSKDDIDEFLNANPAYILRHCRHNRRWTRNPEIRQACSC